MITKPSEFKFPKYYKTKDSKIRFKSTFKKVLIYSIFSSTILYSQNILPERTVLLSLSQILPWIFGILIIPTVFNYLTDIPKFKNEYKNKHYQHISEKLYNYLGEFNWVSPPKKNNECIIAFKNYLVFVNLKKDTINYISKNQIKEFNLKKEHLGSITQTKGYTETIGINGNIGITANSKNESYSNSKNIFNNYLEITTTCPGYEYLKIDFLENDNFINTHYSKMCNIIF